MSLDVKDAVRTALDYVQELFESEEILYLGLEEVERDNGTWLVTVGFSRPWDFPKPDSSDFGATSFYSGLQAPRDLRPKRDYKVLRIDGMSGNVESVKNRK
ncbi:MAG: hypothetical protein AAGC60_12680 [Acidobacteriota bacterium]